MTRDSGYISFVGDPLFEATGDPDRPYKVVGLNLCGLCVPLEQEGRLRDYLGRHQRLVSVVQGEVVVVSEKRTDAEKELIEGWEQAGGLCD